MFWYLFLIFIIIGIYGFLNLGQYLDIVEKPVESDLIVCLGGGKKLVRVKKSVALCDSGYSKNNVLIVTGGTPSTQKNQYADKRMAYLSELDSNISVVYNPYTRNTAEDILYIKKYMEEHHYSTVTIVTDQPHSRRVKMLAEMLGMQDKYAVNIVGSDEEWWDREEYYLNNKSRYSAFSELLKIPYNYLLYGILDKFGYLPEIHELEDKFELRKTMHKIIDKHWSH